MSAKMSSRELYVWETLQVVMENLKREVGRDLWAVAELSDTEFTVIANLRLAEGGMRPSACARAIGWDSSRLAHQLRRLEKRGFVSKRADASDGRASVLVLTAEGDAAYRRAIGPHLRSAQKWFADALDEPQVEALADALETVLAHIQKLTRPTNDSPVEEQK
jgi:DNA-binding MarR family transcriptional regulator